jgi:hypothetical protein
MKIGPGELHTLGSTLSFGELKAPVVPFSDEVLAAHADTHVLIYTPTTLKDGRPITLNTLRDIFGTNPAASEPCFYNQDWYLKEDFAEKTVLDGKWHLLPLRVLEGARAKRPEEIEAAFEGTEAFPTAVTCTFAFFVYWLHTGSEALWKHDFLWCSDRDHNGDRIYVGRYEDPTGVNKNGFNIHRHLTLRPAYSAAPEITG